MNRIFTLLLGIILIALTQQLFSQCGTAINIPTLPVSGQALVCGTNFLNSTSVPGTICVSSGANGTGSEYYKNGNEALYTFTVPANGNYNISYTGQTWSSIILYNGCPTSGGTCVDGFTSTGSSKTLNVNLTTGITYYLWFDTWPSPDSPCPGTFSIALAGAGGPCASVTAMTCGTTYTGTLAATGSDWSSYTGCGYTEPGDEIVYSFTPTTSGSHTFNGTNVSGDPDFFLMSSCGNTGTNVYGSCWSGGNISVNLTAGTTYYLIVDNYSSSATAGYSISVTCPASGPCASVTAMTCGTTYTGTLAATGSDWSTYTNCTYNEAGDEIVYSFTPTTTGSHTLTGTETSGDPDFYLMSSCGNTGTNVIGACWDSGTQTVTLTAGTTYYFIVDNYSSSATAGYSISVTCPGGGDPCTSVTPMTCGTVYTATLGTSNSDWDSYTDCGYAEPGDEMVFSFTPATTDAYTFTGTNTSGDADFFIMSTCGNTGTNILGYCWSLGDETVALTGGTTYYIIADNYSSSSSATFSLSVDCNVGNIIYTCSGTFTDTGGAGGDYAASESYEVTYCPDIPGYNIVLDFTSFVTEENYDELAVYDGLTSAAPNIGGYHGSTTSGLPLLGIVRPTPTNTSGCLTFTFDSDGSGQYAGWSANISCAYPCQEVQVGSTSTSPAYSTVSGVNYVDVCQGVGITFNATGSYPENGLYYTQSDATSTFTWYMGDGTILTGTSVNHTYATEGAYNVSLIIQDIYGCYSSTAINIRVRVSTSPDFLGTTLSPNPVCQGQTLTLTGNASPNQANALPGGTISQVTPLPDGTGTSYYSVMFVDMFTPGDIVTSSNDIVSVCANMEHSYLGDIDIVLVCPNGQSVTLLQHTGANAQILGEPIATGLPIDATNPPGQGIGYDYCWSPTSASGYMTDAANWVTIAPYTDPLGNVSPSVQQVIPQTYQAVGNWTDLVGCPLNGLWRIRVTDFYAMDNGYIFNWGIGFDPSLISTWSFTPTIATQSWSGPNITNAANPGTAVPSTTGVLNYTYTVVDNFGCSYDTTISVTVNPSTTPTFTALGPYCVGATPAALPGTSTNGITGTWSPATISTAASGTTTYTFTPTAGQCASTATMNVTVNANVTPTFTALGPYCVGAAPAALPGTSTNGINGTWSPATISTAAAGTTTYTFTPTAGQCATTATMNVTVNANVTPTFTALGPYCVGAAPAALPGTSTNGINGTWSPATISTAAAGTTTYTFTPTAGQCATTATMNVTVNANVTPTFTALGPYCVGAAPAALPGTSTNGINGTWSPATISTAAAGTITYTFTPTAGQCATTATMNVTVNANVTPTFTALGPYCVGAAPAALPGTSTNGINGTWSPATISTAAAGTTTYTFTPTAGQCATTATMNVTVNANVTPTFTALGPYCVGAAPAALPATSTNGINGTWSPATISTAAAGTITYTFTPTAGQCATTATMNVTVNANVTPTFTALGPYCVGAAPAALPGTSTNGINGTWSPATISTAAAGTITYTFTPTAGQCATTATMNVTVNANVTPTFTALGPYCVGAAPAALPGTSTNGINGTWSPATISTAAAGTTTYTFTPTAGQCATTATMNVTVNANVTPTFTALGPYCVGAAPAALPGTSTNGINGTWSPATISTAAAGTITYTFTPTAGQCATTATMDVTVNTNITPTFNVFGPYCQGEAPDALPLTSNNGVAGTWSPAVISTAATGTTNYTFTPNVMLCNNIATISVTVNENPTASAIPHGLPSCFGATDGSIVLSVSGGLAPYSYLWSNGSTNSDLFSVGAGTYTVTVTDDNGCTTTASTTITEPPQLVPFISSLTNQVCGTPGSATVDAGGGTPPYSYTWPAGAGGVSGGTASILPTGSYTVTVTDLNMCTATQLVTISGVGGITVNSSVTANVSCNGGNNGAIEVTIAGGTPNYTVNWGTGSASTATSPYSITGLTANTYNITVTDANSCQGTTTATITQPTLLTASSSATTINCNGGNSTVTVSAAGGTAPYTGTGTFTVTAGTYNYVVTDNNGCTANTSVTISEPTLLTASTSATPILCNGNNSTVTVTAAGGTAPYTGTGTFTVTAGTYNYVVTDNNGCTANASVNITEPVALTASVTALADQNCALPGSATVTAAGGIAPYTYTWPAGAGGVSGGSASSLTAGTYNVTVADNNGCSLVQPVTIVDIGGITVGSSVTANVSCNGGNNGAIEVTITGGTPNYNVNWGAGSASTATSPYSITGLTANTYNITVTDANSCQGVTTATITQPTLLTASSSATTINCNGGNSTVTVTAAGGTAPYTGTGTFTVTAGTYNYVVTDNNGCSANTSVTVSEPTLLTASASATPILCNGGNSTVTVTAAGGTAPYTGTGTFSVTAGTYNYVVTDNNGCTANASVTITEPVALTASVTALVDQNCALPGSATVTAAGGILPYTYTWPAGAGGVSGGSASSLTAGTYNVTVADNNGCSLVQPVTIVDIGGITVGSSVTANVSCNGGNNGTIEVTITGGTPNYNVNWGTGSASTATSPYSITGLTANTYNITVTDANSCQGVTTATITQPTLLTASSSATTINCNGGNSTVTVSAAGGTAPYTGTGTFTVTAGTYNYVVTDNNGCTANTSVTISEPTLLTASASATPILCNGGNSTVTVAAAGGTAPYTGTGTFSVNAGTYNYVVTDNNGCTANASVTISQPTQLTASVTALVNQNCTMNGSATVTAAGGTAPYTYTWPAGAGGVSGGSASSLTAGTYNVTVADNNGCSLVQPVTIITIGGITVSAITTSNVNCFGGNNGAIQVTTTGGTANYTVNWGTGSINTPNAVYTINGLTGGSYTITVTDGNGCSNTTTTSITTPAAPLTSSATATAIACFGGNSTVTVTASGGTAPYTGTGTFTVTAGAYNYTITDNNGCTSIASVSISQPSQLAASATATSILCNGNNATVTVTATGGTLPYSGTGTFTVPAGSYSYTVTDFNGCTANTSVTISQPTVLVPSIVSITHPICTNLGSATVAATGGTPNYTFTWPVSAGGVVGPTANNLAGGSYIVTVTDQNSCTATITVTLVDAGNVSANLISSTNPQCYGMATGSITIGIAGGTPAYTVNWGTGSASTATSPYTISSLIAGTYSITVTDFNGCQDIITNIAITQPPQLIANLGVITNVSCNGQADGTANIIVSGGTPAYTYTWNPAWVSGPNPTNLTQGNYAVTVSDMNSCSLALNFSINEPTALTVMHTVTNAPCFGGVGTASVTVAGGGIAPYTIMWADGGTSFNHNSVPVNINFGYTVTDNNGCEFISFVNVTQPNQLAASIAGSNAICNGTSTGSATVTVSGGTMPYFYAWSNGGVNSTIGYLSAGSYSVTVTDYNGCTTTQSVDITEPAVVAVNIATNPVVCGTNLGSATASASGGTPPYNYQWNNGTNGPTATNLTAGTYYCTVVDQNTCYVISSINISVTDSITASITEMQSIGCNGESTGTLMAATTSTNMPISYLWSNGVTSQTNSYLSAGAYYVTVSDGWGCSGTQNFNLTEPSLLTATPNISNVGCYGGNNGSISLAVSGGSPAYTCLWSNSATSFNMINLTAGDYAVVVTDNNGCIFTGTYTVSQPAAPLAVVSLVDHISCFGDNDGSLLMNATGGTPPYVFTTTMGTFLSNGNEIHDLLPGTYHIQVIDNNGCQAETNAAVMEPAPMSATYVRTNPSCLGNFDGSIFVNVIGGTAPFWYMANEFSSQTALIDSLRQGIYNIQIIDYNGCEYSFGPVQLIDQNEDCLKIPNAFTPNDDGINDTWIIENLWLFPGAVVQVFNRWGQILYDSGINEGDWDGTYNGKIMPTGSYIYVIRLYAEGDQYSGVVTIVH